MSDTDEETAMWPGSPYALVDTRLCPSCFETLTATTCTNCGLVLADPRAERILELGRSMLELEAKRQQLIGAIRLVHSIVAEPAAVAVEAPEPVTVTPTVTAVPAAARAWWEGSPAPAGAEAVEPSAGRVAVAITAPASTIAAPPSRPAPPAAAVVSPKPPRRRLTVPVLLLILGVSLVGVAAIFFLVLAWNVADIRMRALIIGGITLATMVVASLLRRWSLRATAEAFGALGVILLGLDAWAVQANDLFGAQAMDAVVYAGIATLSVGAVCRLWAVISRLRGPDLAATLALPTGLGLLIAGLVPLEPAGAVTAGLLGTAVGGLAHALPAPWSAARSRAESIPERTALALIGVAALVGGAATSLLLGLESMSVQLVAAGVVIVVGAVYALLLRPRENLEPLPTATIMGHATGALAAAFLGSLGWQIALHSDLPAFPALVAPVVAVLVAVALDRWHSHRQMLLAPRIAAAVVGSVSILALGGVAVDRVARTVTDAWTVWETPVFSPPADSAMDVAVLSAIALALVAALLFLAPTLDRPVLRDVRPIAAGVLLLLGAFGIGIPIVIVSVAIVVSAVGLVGLGRGASPAAWGTVAGIGALTAFLAGLASPWLWAVGVLVAAAVPIAARVIGRPNATAAVVLALTPVAVLTISAFIAPSAIAAASGVEWDARAGLVLVQWVSLAAIAAAASLRLDAPSRTSLAAASYGLFVISLVALPLAPAGEGTVSAAIGEPVLAIVRTTLLVLLFAAVALARTRIAALPSLGAAALVAPAAGCLAIAAYETAGVTENGWAALTAASAAALVVWLGAVLPSGAYGIADVAIGPAKADPPGGVAADVSPPAYRMLARRLADIGALGTGFAAVIVGAATADFRWAMFAVVALGFAGASVTRGWGWAGAAGAESSGIPETRAAGFTIAEAPRRVLAWAAFAAATLALWSWLLDGPQSFQIEVYVLPPAIGLLLFATVLVWLRRQAEATIAVVAGLTLGLVVPAVVAFTGAPEFAASAGSSPLRGTVVAIAAALVTLVLAWTPVRQVRLPALAGAVVAMVALAIVAIGRALVLPAEPGWLVLLVGVAYFSAAGFMRGALVHRASSPDSDPGPGVVSPETWFAGLVPPIALAGAALAVIPSLDEALAVAITLGGMIVIHLAAAALHRLPFATATRWTAMGGATLAAGGALALADVDAVELVSLPLAGALMGGAALAMWRLARAGMPWPGTERIAWLVGLVVAVGPSVIAGPHDVRTWLVIVATLLAATECVVVPLADSRGLKTPSAIILSAGALAMGLRALLHPSVQSGEYAAIVAGAGVIAIAVLMVWQAEDAVAPRASTWLTGGGAAVVVVAVAFAADGGLVRTTVTAILAGVIGVGGAGLLRWPRWAGIGAVLAVAGLIAALIAVGTRFALVAGDGGLEPDLWATAAVGIVVAIGIAALRSSASRIVTLIVSVAFSLALALFAAAELVMLSTSEPDELRTVLTMIALTAVGVVGVMLRPRMGLALPVTAAVLAGLFGLVALIAFAVRPFELVTVPVAVGLLVLGGRTLRRDPESRTWRTLGPGLALLTLPSLVYDFTDPSVVEEPGATALSRVVSLGIVAVALVVAGAVWRLQAPLVLGSVVLLVHAIAQLWPWISDLYAAVEWWVWLGIGGALLIYLGARYERRMRALRTAFTAVTSLR